MEKQTILLVDDDLILQRALKNHLLQKNLVYKIRTAHNGREALNILSQEKIDLVLLDINMPVMDGIQFLGEIHNQKIWLPIIILTGVATMTEAEEGRIFGEFGIVEYMEKPVDFEELDKKVEAVLNRFEIVKKPASGIGIPTILRLIESEKRTGILTAKLPGTPAHVFFRDGNVVDAEAAGRSAMEAFKLCLKPGSEENDISIEYIDHKRTKKIEVSFYEVLLEKTWLISDREKAAAEGKAVIPHTVFDGLRAIPGFIGVVLYRRDGEIIDFNVRDKMNVERLGRLSKEMFKTAGDFTQKMNWGAADFIEIRTKDTIFAVSQMAPGAAALGVVMSNNVNMGRIRLEIKKIINTLSKVYFLYAR